jgi:hypothetical protein
MTLNPNNNPTFRGGGVPQGASSTGPFGSGAVPLPFTPGLDSFATLMIIQTVLTTKIMTVGPYGSFLEISFKEQKLLWWEMIKPGDNHTLLEMAVANSRASIDLFQDKAITYHWMCYMRIPTKGRGSTRPGSTPGGHLIFSMDLSNFKNLIKEFNHLSLDQVTAFASWFMGDLNEPLKTCLPTKMQMKYLDINVPGNDGLLA